MCYNCDPPSRSASSISPIKGYKTDKTELPQTATSVHSSDGSGKKHSSTNTGPAGLGLPQGSHHRVLRIPPAPRPTRRLIVASTSIDLIDLSSDSSPDRYSNFNPGYSSTTPPDDMAGGYPALEGGPSLPVLHEVSERRPRHGAKLSSHSVGQLEDLIKSGVWHSRLPRGGWAARVSSPSPTRDCQRGRRTTSPRAGESPPRSPRSSEESSSSPSPRSPRLLADALVTPPHSPRELRPGGKLPTPPCSPRNRDKRDPAPLYWELEFPPRKTGLPDLDLSVSLNSLPRGHRAHREVQAGHPVSRSATSSPCLGSLPLTSQPEGATSSRGEHPMKRAKPRPDVLPTNTQHGSNTEDNNNACRKRGDKEGAVWVPQARHVKSPPSQSADYAEIDISQVSEAVKARGSPVPQGSQITEQDPRADKENGRSKRRCATPPRVLSPSMDNVRCEVIADI